MLPATCGWASAVVPPVLLPLRLSLDVASVVQIVVRVVHFVPIAGNFHSFRFVPICFVVFDCTNFVWPHRVQLLLLLLMFLMGVVVVVVHVDVKNDMQQLTFC